MQGCVPLPQQNCCGWDGSPGADSPTLPRCGAQRALIHTVLLCGVSDTAALWGWLGDARSGSTSLGRCMGDGGKLLRAALPLSPVQDVPVAVPCPSPGGARIGGGEGGGGSSEQICSFLQTGAFVKGWSRNTTRAPCPICGQQGAIWLRWGCVLPMLPRCSTRAMLFAPRPGSNQLHILCALQKYSSSSPQRYLAQHAGHPSKSSKGFYKPCSDFWKYAWHLQITQAFLSRGACSQNRYSGCARNVDRHQQGAEIWSRIVSPIMCSGLGKGNCSEPQLLGFQLALQLCSSSQSAFLARCCKQGCSDS